MVNGTHIEPESDIYRLYRATYEDATIVVVPLERSISGAQESGMDEKWFAREISEKVQKSPHPEEPRLVTTWSPGEGGGWFLQMHEESGFYGHFLRPYLAAVGRGEIPIQPVLISEYIRNHPPTREVQVRAGPWNFGAISRGDFSQWVGSSETQRAALTKIRKVSDECTQQAERCLAAAEAAASR